MIDILKKAAHKAGAIQLDYYKPDLPITFKTSHQNLLTKADIESQKIIRSTILSEMEKKGYKKNEIGFIGEENLEVKGKHLFVIDPIDGTTNYASGLKDFGVSIAYLKNNKIEAGLIYLPSYKADYTAYFGKGSYKGKKKLSLKYKTIESSLLATNVSSNEKERNEFLKAIPKLYPHTKGIRITGAYVVDSALLVENIFQLHISFRAKIWDFAAAKIIIEEAGGCVSDFSGSPINLELYNPHKSYKTIECHPKLLNDILKFFD